MAMQFTTGFPRAQPGTRTNGGPAPPVFPLQPAPTVKTVVRPTSTVSYSANRATVIPGAQPIGARPTGFSASPFGFGLDPKRIFTPIKKISTAVAKTLPAMTQAQSALTAPTGPGPSVLSKWYGPLSANWALRNLLAAIATGQAPPQDVIQAEKVSGALTVGSAIQALGPIAIEVAKQIPVLGDILSRAQALTKLPGIGQLTSIGGKLIGSVSDMLSGGVGIAEKIISAPLSVLQEIPVVGKAVGAVKTVGKAAAKAGKTVVKGIKSFFDSIF